MTTTAAPVLPAADPASLGLDPDRLERLCAHIEGQIAEGRYPGAQIALARHGRLALARAFGQARIGSAARATMNDDLFLLRSQTKIITTAAVWQLVEQGALRFDAAVSEYVPEFAHNGKGAITLFQVLTHQGGYPNAVVPEAAWTDHDLLRRVVSDFTLEWTPGSRVHYHGASAHWTAAVVIEAVTGRDFRDVIREELLAPLGLDDIVVGAPASLHQRMADMHEVVDGVLQPLASVNTPEHRAAGIPGGGGYASATAYTAFYQMLLAGGTLNGRRALAPRTIQFATRNHTGDRIDENFGMPMHRGIGPHLRGKTPRIRGLGSLAHPRVFGHGGAGSSYTWADPETGVSFTYLSNASLSEPWHSIRMDRISNLAHAAVVEL